MSDGQAKRGGFFRGFLVGIVLSLVMATFLTIVFPVAGTTSLAPSTPPEVVVDVPTARSNVGDETSGVETPDPGTAEAVPVVPDVAPIEPETVAEPSELTQITPETVDTVPAETPAVAAAVTANATEQPDLQGFSADVTTPGTDVANATAPRSAESNLQAAEMNAMLESPDVSTEPMIPLEPMGGDLSNEQELMDMASGEVNVEPMIPLGNDLEPMVDITPDIDVSASIELAPSGAELAEEGIIALEDAPAEAATLPEGEEGLATPETPSEGVVDGAADEGATPEATGDAAEAASDAGTAEAATTPEVAPGALGEFARVFDYTGANALLAVVLVDAGASGLDIAKLAEIGMPLTIGIPSDVPDAMDRTSAYRDAGFEVVAIAPKAGVGAFRKGQNSEEAPLQLEAIFSAVPQAVAVMDPPGGELPKDNQLVRAVLAGLVPSGHALLTQSGGFNSVADLASEVGVYSQTVMRQIDNVDAVNFAMSRAALQAGKTGAAIIMADTSPEMVKAVVQWLLSPSARTIALAPVSATVVK